MSRPEDVVTMAELPAEPFVLVTVGTDHHPFDRVMGWVQQWLDGGPGRRCVVQHGTSAPPPGALSTPFLAHDVLAEAMRRAVAVVCHGGPGTILEARAAGHVPVVVPRDPARGEHVDDHQVRFSARLAATGDVLLPGSADALASAIEDASAARREAGASGTDVGAAAVARFDAHVSAALGRRGSVAEPPVPVVLIAGLGRSGSTLLDRMLGQVEGCCSLGEVVHVWSRGVRDDERCACGAPFSRCTFWAAVGEAAFGGWDQVDVEEVLAAQGQVERDRFLPQLAMPSGRLPGFDRRVDAYGDALTALYRAALQVSGKRWVIDSSKHVSTAYMLRRLGSVDLRMVHLVRDSRGVAYSWTKVKGRPEAADGSTMARWHPAHTAARYLTYNALLHRLAAVGVPSTIVRYETLVAEPEAELRRVLGLIEMSDVALPFLRPDSADLRGTHNIGGNPMRFAGGEVRLHVDEQWRESMPAGTRALVTGMTAPLLATYGYLGRGPAGEPAPGGRRRG